MGSSRHGGFGLRHVRLQIGYHFSRRSTPGKSRTLEWIGSFAFEHRDQASLAPSTSFFFNVDGCGQPKLGIPVHLHLECRL